MSTEPREVFPYTDFGRTPEGTAFARIHGTDAGMADFRPTVSRVMHPSAQPAPPQRAESDETEPEAQRQPEFSFETASSDAAALAAALTD